MKTKYSRKGNKIKNIETGDVEVFKGTNAAKRKSRQLQISEDGAIGRGSLVLV